MGGGVLLTCSQLALLRAGAVAALVAGMIATGTGVAAAAVVGPDVASHNHDKGAAVNWRVMHRVGGADFAFVKATEDRTYVNPRFASDFRAANRMPRGAYHFARPSGANYAQVVADARAEANFFVHTAGTMRGRGILPPVLDIEEAGTLNPRQLSWWTHTWLERVERLTGRQPIVYTNPGFWKESLKNTSRFRRYSLWLASYGVAKPVLVGGWKRCTFWQYTDRGRLAGSSRRLDLNVFNGSLAQLRALTLRSSVSPVASRASGRPRTPARSRKPATSDAPSRALAVSGQSVRSMTPATHKYIHRLRDSDSESRPRMWPNVFTRGGIREIGP